MKNPKKIIESGKNLELEQAYVKFPGEKLINVSLERRPKRVEYDLQKIKDLYKKKNKKYMEIHTHPGGTINPSPHDVKRFLRDQHAKSMIIAPLQENGKLRGYFILRKTKKTPKRKLFLSGEKKYEKIFNETPFVDDPQLKYAMEDLAKKWKLQYKYIPVEKSNSTEKYLATFFSKKGLENKLLLIVMSVGLSISLFFLSSKITGNVILNLSLKNQNMIGVFLFISCLVALLFYVRNLNLNKVKTK
jgi:hypothetical protein